ncbi:MAG: AI-2E family transporter [Leptospiraceae bacterium]|nr:AI-2E family transporter [Leptospiraceae bacterium]MCP5497515.1 AI-2E family transporter [Leptospiraceae bacterium]
MKRNKYETLSFILFLIFVVCLMIYMMWNFLTSIIFATIIAGTFYPFFRHLVQKTKWSRNICSLIVCLFIVLVIFIPGVYLIVRFSKEIMFFYEGLRSNINEETIDQIFFGNHYFSKTTSAIFQLIGRDYTIPSIKEFVTEGLSKISLTIFESLNQLVGNIFSFLFQFFIMLVAIFAIFKHGEELQEFLLDLSPLRNEDEKLIFKQFNTMNYVTLVSNGIGGVIQGVLAGIGFWIAGIESILLWTIFMIVLAFIPILGISLVSIPVCIYLFFIGKVWTSIILFIYCSTIALLVENWFKPKFIGEKVKINSFLVFFSILGGMSVFGMAGIFYGPIIASIFLTVSNLYLLKYEEFIKSNREE